MGLFDGLLNPQTPEQEGLLALAAQLLGARKGDNAIGQGLLAMGNARNQAKSRKEQEELRRLQMEQQQMQMQQMRQQEARQAQEQALAQRFGGHAGGLNGDGMGPEAPPQAPNAMGFAQGLFSIDPARSMQMQAQLAPPRPKMQFAPNGQAVDMNALQLGQNYGKPPDWKDPEYEKVQSRIRAAGSTKVSVDNRQESEFNKTIGKSFAENYNGILQNGAAATDKLRTIQRFENIVSKVPTGKLEPFKAEVGKLAASLGVKVDTEKLGFQEALDSLSNQYALTLRNPGSGAGMPGALSDKDREFLVSMAPSLAKTPAGNKIILEAFKRVAQREAEVAKLARDYKKKTGKFDEGFYEVLAQHFGGSDLLGDLMQQAGGVQGQENVIDFSQLRPR